MYNADDHDTITNTNIGHKSDPEEDINDNKDLCLYIKTIAQCFKCYY